MQLLRELIASGVRNPVRANLMMVMILVGGYLSARGMVREAFPEFSLDHIEVQVAYPGASTADVEVAICSPIEDAVRGISGVFEISSSAQENYGIVWLALVAGVGDPQYVLDEVKARVDQIKTFPPDAEKPIIRESIIRTAVTNIAIYGDVPERTLKRFAQDVRDDLVAMRGLSQAVLSGVREDEIIVEVSGEALAAYDLSLPQIMEAISENSMDLPAGVIRTAEEEFTLRTSGRRYTAKDYEDLIVIHHDGAVVRMRDIGTVREGFEEAEARGEFNGERAIVVQIYKTPDEDATEIARKVREYVAARQPGMPERLHLSVWADRSHDIDGRISMLVKNGAYGIALVFLTLACFLERRLAFWVAVGIPVAFAGALIVVHAGGHTLNMISMFALIMVVGIIVDDAIVIAESVHAQRRAGATPELASIEGTYRMALPVMGASLTTVVAFIPLMYVVGVMGRFIYVLPVVVIAAVAASTVEAFGILPSHLCHRPERGVDHQPKPVNRFRQIMDRWIVHVIQDWYRPIYRMAIRARVITASIAVALLLVTGGLVYGGRTPFILLPIEDGNILRARVRFVEGTPLSVTEEAVDRLTKAAWDLNEDPELVPAGDGDLVRQVYAVIGEFNDFITFRGNNLCDVRVELMAPEVRGISDEKIMDHWRRSVGQIHDATRVTMRRNPMGPLTNPIEIRLLGRNLEDMQAASARIQAKLREYDGLFNIEEDLIPGKRELVVTLSPSAHTLGLSVDDVAKQLRLGFYGGEALILHRDRDRVTVRIRYPSDERRSIADLEHVRIKTPDGNEVPFREVANVRWARGYSFVMHQDGRRRLRVTADVDDRRANAERIVSELDAAFLGDVVSDYNELIYSIAGNREYIEESLESLYVGFLMAMVAIYALLGWILHSYLQPLVILIAVPLGMIGVVGGHVLLGYNLSLISIFGAVAVSGVVINDALVLLDTVNRGISDGIGVTRAVLRAGELRFRAVTLTSITTVMGLLPILLERSSQAESVKPMAVSLGFGLLFATGLTLFVVPAAFMLLNDVRRFARWLRYGGAYPRPELVEDPASVTASHSNG